MMDDLTGLDSQAISDINIIARFLAVRNVNNLTREELHKHFAMEQADMLILLGNSLVHTWEEAAKAFLHGIAKAFMIVGGIGHSTDSLRHTVARHAAYRDIDVKDRPEADIIKDIVVKHWGIPEDRIIVENQSTNCGDNASKALDVLLGTNCLPESMILMQDPTMQLRTHASFLQAWSRVTNKTFINYASFIPCLVKKDHAIEFEGHDHLGQLWTLERFLSLMMGEIPRLLDHPDGYGPKGRGFIAHVDIPDDVQAAYGRLLPVLPEKLAPRRITG